MEMSGEDALEFEMETGRRRGCSGCESGVVGTAKSSWSDVGRFFLLLVLYLSGDPV